MFTEFLGSFMSSSYPELADESRSVYEVQSIYRILGSELSLMEVTEEDDSLPWGLIGGEEDRTSKQ